MWDELPRIYWVHWWSDRQSNKYWNRLCFVLHSSRGRKKWNPHLPCLSEKGVPCLVWHGCPSAFRRVGNSSSLTGILQSGVQETLAVVRTITVTQSAVSAVRFYTAPGAQLVLTPCLAQDVPKDTSKSIICNTTVIIYFSSLEYVFMGFGVERLFLLLSCFCSWTKADLQCRNNGLLRASSALAAVIGKAHTEAFGINKQQFHFLSLYPEISWISFNPSRPRIPPANWSVAEATQG